MELERRYHVPRSQVWEGSRGRQSGKVHLHVPAGAAGPMRFGRIVRAPGRALCGRVGWYERPPYEGELELCTRCGEVAARVEAASRDEASR